ncbi:MAG: hypothetical protein EA376_07685 [Phycisphaeraceae bacterium]|nr:MAG: hypothetical protein EA376_07685 [Phycisphaeraceae bacterium]
MKVFSKLSNYFAKSGRRSKDASGTNGAGRSALASATAEGKPLEIEIDRDDEGALDREIGQLAERRPGAPAPRNKNEMIAELQKNYEEVLELVRKLDGHLDLQERRAERLMEIAERIPAAMDAIPEIRDQGARMVEAVDRLAEATREGDERVAEAVAGVGEHVQRTGQVEEELRDSVTDFRSALGEMTGANARVGDTLDGMRRSSETREQRLVELIATTRRTMVTIGVICGAVAVVAILIAVIAIMG